MAAISHACRRDGTQSWCSRWEGTNLTTQEGRCEGVGRGRGEEDADAGRGCVPRRTERRSEGNGTTEMLCVTVEIHEGTLTYRARVIAPSIEHALKIARGGKPGRRVRLIFPIDPEAFFVSADSGTREAA